MRWVIALVIAAAGAAIAGPKGAVIGFVLGCLIAALLFRKERDIAASPSPKMAVPKAPSVQHTSDPPPLPTASSGPERLHELMRQIEASRSAADRDVQSARAGGIGVSISFGEAQPL